MQISRISGRTCGGEQAPVELLGLVELDHEQRQVALDPRQIFRRLAEAPPADDRPLAWSRGAAGNPVIEGGKDKGLRELTRAMTVA
ncbi:MAG: hypothetical protein GY856_37135 [bacterium]|nr:hypothetical protein [bacterium]